MTVDSAIKGDLPSTMTSALALRDSLSNIVNKRMYGFTISIAEIAEEIEKHQTQFIENLPRNEKFISAYSASLLIASRNHQKEKLDALRNAVLNTALPSDIGEDLQLSFVNYIDRLTPSHIVALQAYSDYWNKNSNANNWNRHNVNITEIEIKYHSYLDELIGLGMLLRPDMTSDSAGAYMGSRTCIITPKGDQFLEFIKSPLERIVKS
jgi:predicted DNA-binding protein YlxM (UPF0122 family)